MSYNPNFFNNFYNRGNNFTFQNNLLQQTFPLLPPPPPPVTPQIFTPVLTDQDFLKKFEIRIPKSDFIKINATSISALREEIYSLITSFNDIQKQEKYLIENVETLSDDEWKTAFKSIEINKITVSAILDKLNGSYLDMSRKLLTKRSSKRMRLRRLRQERQQEKKEKTKEMEEKSRVIDENLQKIKDTILQTQRDEEAKLHADVVLKDVIRKKSEAKKCISKLEALVRLRRARQNTAKGRGEKVSESDLNIFQANLDKLKSMWIDRLSLYETEENDLRLTLQENVKNDNIGNDNEKVVLENLNKWKELLFAGKDPQFDFHGDVQKFISVREQWDRCISKHGSPLPIGWVLPRNQL